MKIQPSTLIKPVTLTGMPGAGKTSIGHSFAKAACLPFLDSDQMIANDTGLSITEVFSYAGEKKFREMEYAAIESALNHNPSPILSIGGGAFSQPKTRTLLKRLTFTIFIDIDIDQLIERLLENKGDRPLLQTDNPSKTVRNLYNQRIKDFEQADYTLNVTDQGISANMQSLYQALANASIIE